MPRAERAVCVVLHDVSPATWPACQSLLEAVDALGRIPVTLLVVPEHHRGQAIDDAPGFAKAIETRLRRGDEVAVHGCFHLDDLDGKMSLADRFMRRLYTAGEGEFAALDEATASERLARGLASFRRLGWPVAGFVAPAWLLGPGARAALGRSAFRYTSTRRDLYTLPDWQSHGSPSLVWSVRSSWRRRGSVLFNTLMRRRLRRELLLRLGLHPADAAWPAAVQFWLDTLRESLPTRVALTKARWLGLS